MPITEQDPQRELFLALLQRQRSVIWKLCLRHEHDDHCAAADLVQEAAQALWRYRGSLRPDSTPRQERRWVAWRVRAILYEHDCRQRRNLLVLGQPYEGSEEPSVDDDLTFAALLATLPHADRQLVDLRLAGYSDREIGDRLGITAAAVRVRMFRLVRRLRRVVAREEQAVNRLSRRQ